jgi:hypothetical protein
MGNPQIDEMTRREWRELGFFYDRNDVAREWLLVGSKAGLQRFAKLLFEYASDPRHDLQSEHDHYGPYLYLKIMTWPDAGMDENAIFGTLSDLHRLANVVEQAIGHAQSDETVRIRDEYVSGAEYSLVLSVKADDFDPASVDGCLQNSETNP